MCRIVIERECHGNYNYGWTVVQFWFSPPGGCWAEMWRRLLGEAAARHNSRGSGRGALSARCACVRARARACARARLLALWSGQLWWRALKVESRVGSVSPPPPGQRNGSAHLQKTNVAHSTLATRSQRYPGARVVGAATERTAHAIRPGTLRK